MSGIVKFVYDFQTLLTGLCAIFAAVVALIAVGWSTTHLLESQKRATAGALWAELAGLGSRLFADAKKFEARLGGMFEPYVPRALTFLVFDANRSSIGQLPADAAFMIINLCMLLFDFNERYTRFKDSGGRNEKGADLGAAAEKLSRQTGSVLRGFYETAGISIDQANAALGNWTEKIKTND